MSSSLLAHGKSFAGIGSRLSYHLDQVLGSIPLGYLCWYRPATLRWLQARSIFPLLGSLLAFGVPTFWPLHESVFLQTFGFVLIYIGFGTIVCYAAGKPDFAIKNQNSLFRLFANGIASLGVYSYTIYLAHSVIFMTPGMESVRQRLLEFAEPHVGSVSTLWLDRSLFWLLAILLGVVLSHLIERPFLRLRSRIYSPSLVTGTGT